MPWFWRPRRGPLAPRDNATSDIAFRFKNNVGTPTLDFAAQ
jgi:hypothetical protein